MKDTCFTTNFWLMIGIFVLIVLTTMIGLSFLINQADFQTSARSSDSHLRG